jgi:hypothetical protein
VKCPSCTRTNDDHRRYCGRCGFNFDPVCRGCDFVNAHDDRFCGGCGSELWGKPVKAPALAPRLAIVSTPTQTPTDNGELHGLFAKTAAPEEVARLPDSGVSQSDLDKLFGGNA